MGFDVVEEMLLKSNSRAWLLLTTLVSFRSFRLCVKDKEVSRTNLFLVSNYFKMWAKKVKRVLLNLCEVKSNH